MSALTMLSVKTMATRVAHGSIFILAGCLLAIGQSLPGQSLPGQSLPQVRLDATGLAPRPIEELTGTAVARCYAQAWRDVAEALAFSRTDRIGEQFVGFAKDRLSKRIREQRQTGVHVRITDRGHNLKAVFYSADGAAMQLFDQANLEIQTFDGDKLLATENVPHEYMVLMTPGADRWYVRDLEEVPPGSF
jgi:hypothetical protein